MSGPVRKIMELEEGEDFVASGAFEWLLHWLKLGEVFEMDYPGDQILLGWLLGEVAQGWQLCYFPGERASDEYFCIRGTRPSDILEPKKGK